MSPVHGDNWLDSIDSNQLKLRGTQISSNTVEDQSISASIDESSTDNESDKEYISMNSLEDIQDGSQIHPYINAIYAKFKIYEHIRQT